MQWTNAPASRERKLDFQFRTYNVSSSIRCIKTVGLSSIQFTGIDRLRILYTPSKIYANWMNTSSWILCLKNDLYFSMHIPADKRTQDRHFSANGFVAMGLIAMKFERD